jgi:hypothetical protein
MNVIAAFNERTGTMLTLVEGHPNADLMLFYLIAAITLGALLYRFHQRRI